MFEVSWITDHSHYGEAFASLATALRRAADLIEKRKGISTNIEISCIGADGKPLTLFSCSNF